MKIMEDKHWNGKEWVKGKGECKKCGRELFGSQSKVFDGHCADCFKSKKK